MINSETNLIIRAVLAAEAKAEKAFQRLLVIFSGSRSWVDQTVFDCFAQLPEKCTLLVTNRTMASESNINQHQLRADQLGAYLGSETERLVWDGFSGLHPDGLGAASGLLKGGGLLILMLPAFTELQRHPDPDYLRMCTAPDQLQSCGTRFLQRMIRLIEADTDIQVFSENGSFASHKQHQATGAHHISVSAPMPTADQMRAIEAIVATVKGHRKRPLVLQADRGRGKSSALGLAAAKLAQDNVVKNDVAPIILVTAPTRLACAAVFHHFEHALGGQSTATSLRFVPPDELLATLPACSLLMVDEAAAIPAALLTTMLEHYPRIVFATTLHGYEGTGQGFALRFRKMLDKLTPSWQMLTLSQPVRWSEGDPLERWMASLLLLNVDLVALPNCPHPDYLTAPVQWLAQTTLVDQEPLLEQVIGLLVLAHYQTAPSDIRLILDHPAIRLGVIEVQGLVVAVILLLEEGGLTDADLATALIQGTRRPRGHLIPQALTASNGLPELLLLKTYRVMRLTVRPELQSQGLGSRLLGAAADLTRTEGFDYLSVSYGYTTELMTFWIKNRFQLVRLGYHRDAASGTHAAMMVQPLSAPAERSIQLCHADFQRHFLHGLSRFFRALDWHTALGVLHALNLSVLPLNGQDLSKIEVFAQYHRSFEDSAVNLHQFILSCIATHAMQRLQAPQQGLLISKILQGRSWPSIVKHFKLSGRKQAEQLLRQAIAELLEGSRKLHLTN